MIGTIGETMNQDGRFSGDMDRNEVEIDLIKFMAMIQENNDLKQKIFMLEHDDTKSMAKGYSSSSSS